MPGKNLGLERLLLQKKTAICQKWLHLIFESYPSDTRRFLRQEKDRFLNPVGYITTREIETIYEGLIRGMNPDRLSASLDNVIRIRAVQGFPPSQAIAFIFDLKKVVREELAGERENQLLEELLDFDARIDKLAALAMDIYMGCREQLFDIRIDEVKSERERALILLERMMGRKDETTA